MKDLKTIDDYVSTPIIKSMDELVDKIRRDIQPAWRKFVTEHNIPIINSSIVITTSRDKFYFEVEADKLTPSDLGLFANVISECEFTFFGGRQIEGYEYDNKTDKTKEFRFIRKLWSSLNVSYSSIRGGSNGMEYCFNGDSGSLYYDIIDRKFSTK